MGRFADLKAGEVASRTDLTGLGLRAVQRGAVFHHFIPSLSPSCSTILFLFLSILLLSSAVVRGARGREEGAAEEELECFPGTGSSGGSRGGRRRKRPPELFGGASDAGTCCCETFASSSGDDCFRFVIRFRVVPRTRLCFPPKVCASFAMYVRAVLG
jgi:hypothetical protein